MAKIPVYFFEGYDIATDRFLESKRPARLDVIKRMGYTANMAKV